RRGRDAHRHRRVAGLHARHEKMTGRKSLMTRRGRTASPPCLLFAVRSFVTVNTRLVCAKLCHACRARQVTAPEMRTGNTGKEGKHETETLGLDEGSPIRHRRKAHHESIRLPHAIEPRTQGRAKHPRIV